MPFPAPRTRPRRLPSAALVPCLLVLCATGDVPAAQTLSEATPREVRFASGDITVSGLLHLPAGTGPHPAVVLLPGSGGALRDAPWQTAVAAAFTDRGIAALATDSRGHGESGGDFDAATFAVLAADAAAAVAMLRGRPDIRADAVGIWGVSQGGTWVGPLAAERAGAAFLVAAAGPLASPEAYTAQALASALRKTDVLGERDVQRIVDARRDAWNYYATGEGYERVRAAIEELRAEPWGEGVGLPSRLPPPDQLDALPAAARRFVRDLHFDALEAIGRVSCPVLVVYGGDDDRIPVSENRERLLALAERADVDITVEVLPGHGHDLLSAGGIRTDAGSSDPVGLMARWVADRVGAGRER